jgi:hypothetical protein
MATKNSLKNQNQCRAKITHAVKSISSKKEEEKKHLDQTSFMK